MLNWPPRLDLARLPTPLTPLRRYSSRFDGVTLWVKHDELTGLETTGNKVRKLEFCIAQALADGCDTLITCGGEQSNHCRATAILGARLGLKVHLILRGSGLDHPDGNLLLDRLAGARIDVLPPERWGEHPTLARQLQERYRAQGRRAAFFPTGASDEVGVWGYVAACVEMQADFARLDLQPDCLVVATGSGGTQAGLVAGVALTGLDTRVVAFAVSDDADWFAAKVRQDLHAWRDRYGVDLDVDSLPVTTVDHTVAPGYGRAHPAVFETIHTLAQEEGLFLDPVYTGKAFHGMVAELQKAQAGEPSVLAGAREVVFVHTGGLFGVFPQRHHFTFSP